MKGSTARGSYDTYAFQRITQKLNELVKSHPNLSFTGIADAIAAWKNMEFHREYLVRLRNHRLGDPHVNMVVEWIVAHHDPKFREKLSPDAIFWEVGESSRDFYFHLAKLDQYETWEEEILQAFSGVYICAPQRDRNSYLPMSMVRDFFARTAEFEPQQKMRRSVDIKQYTAERSILILRHTPAGYYHAAEFPLSLLFPPDFITLDVKMVHEGVGIASGNSIRVFLRECLSRVGKSHSILITPKGQNEDENPHGLSIYTAGEVRIETRKDWAEMEARSLLHMRREFADTIELDYHLTGTAQIEVSPLPDVKNRIETTFSRDYIYHPKPKEFLRDPELHFIRPDIIRAEEIERVVSNPLAVGSLI